MKVLLANEKTKFNFKDIGEIECNTKTIIENDDTQVYIYNVREVMDFEKESKGNYEFEGVKYYIVTPSYYGKLEHAIRSFVESVTANMELTTDIEVWKKIENTLRDLSGNDGLKKMMKEYKK